MTTQQTQALRARLLRWLPTSGIAAEAEAALGPGYTVEVVSVGGQSRVGTVRVTGPEGVSYVHVSAVQSKL